MAYHGALLIWIGCPAVTREVRSVMEQYAIPKSHLICHGDIDEEHQDLIDILNLALQMVRVTPDPTPHQIYPYLENLREGLKLHFRHEEREMARLRYPDLPNHRTHHAHCVQRLDGICDAVASGEKQVDKDLMDDLFDMIMDDIIRADGAFKSFLEGTDLRVAN